MSIDRELIAMSDCPEIQDRWEPKAGDFVINYIRTRKQVDKETIKLGRKEIGTQILTSPSAVEHRDLVVYIPRIEDVLEWLGKRLHQIHNMPMIKEEAYFLIYASPNGILENYIRDGFGDKSLIKALIKAYMHLEHNKTWDGEAWHGTGGHHE